MKSSKIVIITIISFIFSGCFFLEYAIPEAYQYETYTFDDEVTTSELSYIWISHASGIQCKFNYFESLQDAEFHLNVFNIETYDSFENNISQQKKCGYPTELTYYVKIMNADYGRATSLGWWKSKKTNHDTKR